MSLSKMDKDVTTRLFQMLSNNDNNIQTIKNNYSQYAQLKLIAEQIHNLQNLAHAIIKNAEMSSNTQQ